MFLTVSSCPGQPRQPGAAARRLVAPGRCVHGTIRCAPADVLPADSKRGFDDAVWRVIAHKYPLLVWDMLVPSIAAATYFTDISKGKVGFKLYDQASLQIAKRLLFRWTCCHYYNLKNQCNQSESCKFNFCAFCGPTKSHPMCDGCPFFAKLAAETEEATKSGDINLIGKLKLANHMKVLDMLPESATPKAIQFLKGQLHSRPQGLHCTPTSPFSCVAAGPESSWETKIGFAIDFYPSLVWEHLISKLVATKFFHDSSGGKVVMRTDRGVHFHVAKQLLRAAGKCCHFYNMTGHCGKKPECTMDHCAFCGPHARHPMVSDSCPYYQSRYFQIQMAEEHGLLDSLKDLTADKKLDILQQLELLVSDAYFAYPTLHEYMSHEGWLRVHHLPHVTLNSEKSAAAVGGEHVALFAAVSAHLLGRIHLRRHVCAVLPRHVRRSTHQAHSQRGGRACDPSNDSAVALLRVSQS